jgi:phosphoribosyl-ATP pyrophosphohydrolase
MEQKSDGAVSAALMDEKGFSKSREQGELWLPHPQTGRILPHAGNGRFQSLEKRGNSYYAVLSEDAGGEPYADLFEEGDVEAHAKLGEGVEEFDAEILASLTETIRKRHKDMPEGSYTTHLFEKGTGKIKKKCGEEAIELVLADKSEDYVYESADLIYHMMVLLEAEGLSMADVLAELKKRDG